MMLKQCKICRQFKTLSEFHLMKNGKYGVRSWCKDCRKLKEQTPEQKEQKAKYDKKRNLQNAEQRKINSQAYYLKNMEKIKASSKNRYYQTKEKNRPKRATYIRVRRQIDIQFKITCSLRRRLYGAIKNSWKLGSAVKDLGCSIEEFKLYFESLFQLGMTWDNWGNKKGQWSIDHIQPLSSFDLTDRGNCLEACHWTNLQPLWHIDNLKKFNHYEN